MQSLWQWKNTAVGGKVAAISFNAEGAYGLRLGVLVEQLPGSATVRVYTQSAPVKVFQISGQAILQLIERNQAAGDQSDAARTWWTPIQGRARPPWKWNCHLGSPQARWILPCLSCRTFSRIFPCPQPRNTRSKSRRRRSTNRTPVTSTTQLLQQRPGHAMLWRACCSPKTVAPVVHWHIDEQHSKFVKPYFLTAIPLYFHTNRGFPLETRWFYRSPSCNSGTLQSSSVRKKTRRCAVAVCEWQHRHCFHAAR